MLQPGDDPQLQDEVIVVGAHYDHVGYGNDSNSFGPIGKIHNGADDNASGTSVLLETIEAFANSGLKTRRSILFAFWDGEENGTGRLAILARASDAAARAREARYHARHGRPAARRAAVCARHAQRLRHAAAVQRSRSTIRCGSISPGSFKANSDHWPFLERRIPIALLHTGLHADYHRPSDDVGKDQSRRDARGVSLFAGVAHQSGERRSTAKVSRRGDAARSESMRRQLEQPLPKRRSRTGRPISRGRGWASRGAKTKRSLARCF